MRLPPITVLDDPLADGGQGGADLLAARRSWIGQTLEKAGRREPLRVLIVSNTLGTGGAEHQIVRLMPHLNDLGLHTEHFYYAEPHHLRPRLDRKGVTSHFLERAAMGQYRFWKAGLVLMRRGGYDIVHAFSESANFYGRGMAWLAGVPVILGGWRTRPMWPKYRHRIPFSLLNLATSAWVINARTNAEGLGELWWMRGLRTYVLPNALDLDPVADFTPRPLDPETQRWVNGRMIVGAVGRIAPQKNFDMLLDVAARVAARRSDVCFCVAGGTQSLKVCQDYDRHLRARMERENLGGVVRFLGRLDDVAGFLPNLAVSVCTSDWEGCPNCVIEAMRAGRPVVMTDCADTELLIEEGVSGHVVPIRDTEGMVRRTLELLDDQDRRRRFGQRARELVERHFSAPNSAWLLGRIYIEEWLRKQVRRRG